MIQQMLNRMCTENHILKKKLGNQKMITFFSCLGLASYISIDKHTLLPLISFFVVYLLIKLKGKCHEES